MSFERSHRYDVFRAREDPRRIEGNVGIVHWHRAVLGEMPDLKTSADKRGFEALTAANDEGNMVVIPLRHYVVDRAANEPRPFVDVIPRAVGPDVEIFCQVLL